jgi:hypothetical protein
MPLCDLQDNVQQRRKEAETYLLQHIGCIPEAVGLPGTAFRLLLTANTQPTASTRDLMAMAWGPATQLRAFNPFLSEGVCKQLQQGILIWLQLCVLEDKLGRVQKLQDAGEQYTQLLTRVGHQQGRYLQEPGGQSLADVDRGFAGP